jgi:mannose-6-phosphate isomerase-like protein (cupin superfamily)
MANPKYQVVNLSQLPGIECSCGTAHRAFTDDHSLPLTIHRTEISATAERHYHRVLTEIYCVLECGHDAHMELDGDRVAVGPGICVLIPPGVRHRAVGPMTVLIVVTPKFDPADEWFD